MRRASADSGFGLLPDRAWIATRYACPRVESITTNTSLKHNCSYGIIVVLRSKVKMCKGEKMFYLSENLKKYRIMKNLTQEDVAEYLGLTPQSISKWERGISQT